jgi:hypothetical protein
LSNASNVTLSGTYPLFLSTGSNLIRDPAPFLRRLYPSSKRQTSFRTGVPESEQPDECPGFAPIFIPGSFPGEQHPNKVKYEPRNPPNLPAQGEIPMKRTVSGPPVPFAPDFDRPRSCRELFEQTRRRSGFTFTPRLFIARRINPVSDRHRIAGLISCTTISGTLFSSSSYRIHCVSSDAV